MTPKSARLRVAGNAGTEETEEMTATTHAPAPRNTHALREYFAQPREGSQPDTRRWGFEIETPEVGALAYALDDNGFRVYHDGSVTAPDCECECNSCAHSCNCEHCQINDYGLDHCGECQANEAASPVNFKPSPDHQREVLDQLHAYNTEDLENGGHIHIEGRDLTIRQMLQIGKYWGKVAQLLPDLVGRDYCEDYAQDAREWPESERLGVRMVAVNFTNLVSWNSRGEQVNRYSAEEARSLNRNPKGAPTDTYKSTVEFRQFASTAHAPTIYARAAVCRALVDYFASGQPAYWIARATTAEELLEALQPESH
jgi:hypothetical protein